MTNGNQQQPVPVLRRAAIAAAISIAVALQIQTTLSLGGQAIRVSLSDIVLMPLLAFPILVLIRSPKAFPWSGIFLALGICLTLALAYWRIIVELGTPTSWATTKLIGGFALLAYFVVGSAVAIQGGQRTRSAFVVGYVLMAIILVLLFLIVSFFPSENGGFLGAGWRYIGLADNPSAVGLSLLLALCLAVANADIFQRSGVPGAFSMTMILLLVGLFLTTSGAVWGATIAVLAVFFILRIYRARMLIAHLIIALAISAAMSGLSDKSKLQFQVKASVSKVIQVLEFVGIPVDTEWHLTISPARAEAAARRTSIAPRTVTNKAAYQMWLEAPVLGKGLGYFLASQPEENNFGKVPIQVHNTVLWLMAETGLLGSGAFLGFLIFSSVVLYRKSRRPETGENDETRHFALAVLVFLLAWQIMSLAHELMYQRSTWFALGMALASIGGLGRSSTEVRPESRTG